MRVYCGDCRGFGVGDVWHTGILNHIPRLVTNISSNSDICEGMNPKVSPVRITTCRSGATSSSDPKCVVGVRRADSIEQLEGLVMIYNASFARYYPDRYSKQVIAMQAALAVFAFAACAGEAGPAGPKGDRAVAGRTRDCRRSRCNWYSRRS